MRSPPRAERMAKVPKPDLYATLGVHPGAEDIVIRAAFKALAQRYHPDRFSGSKDEAHRRMSDLTAAYEVLADPVRRRKHDRHRYIYARIASLHGKDPPIGKRLGSAVISRVSVAVRQRRYRVALSTLMVTVVILSTFNVYQYSDRLREMLKTSPSAPAAESKIVDAPATPISLMQGTSPTGAPADASAVIVSPPPIGATVTTATVGAAKPRTETKPPGTKPAAARNAPARRPDAMPPAVAASEPCSDVVVALGLCAPNSTGKKK